VLAARCRTVADPGCHTVRLKAGGVDSALGIAAREFMRGRSPHGIRHGTCSFSVSLLRASAESSVMVTHRSSLRTMLLFLMIPAVVAAGIPQYECHCGAVHCSACSNSPAVRCCCGASITAPQGRATCHQRSSSIGRCQAGASCGCVIEQTLAQSEKPARDVSPPSWSVSRNAEVPLWHGTSSKARGGESDVGCSLGGVALLRRLSRWLI
jgi:hypothetical protein